MRYRPAISGSVLAAGGFAVSPTGLDDTSMLIAAALAASTAAGNGFGGGVLMNPGLYKVSGTIANGSNLLNQVRLVGAGKNATVIRKTANVANAMLDFSGSSAVVGNRSSRGGMVDLKLDGGGFTGPLLRAKWADHLNFDRVWLYNNSDTGAWIENCWDTYFNNVEFDTCSGNNGLGPSVLIRSNSDDSSNIIKFEGCRWEAFRDSALVIASGGMAGVNNPGGGANPVYGVYLHDCKMESAFINGNVIDMSNDVETVHVDGLYIAARGISTGGPYALINLNGADDLVFKRIRARINGAATVYSVFYAFTNASGTIEDVLVDCANNPTNALFAYAGGTPDFAVRDLRAKFGQTPTLVSGTTPTVASAATLTLPRSAQVVKVSGTTGITSITAQPNDRVVRLVFTGVLTVTDGGNLKLNGNLTTAANTTLTLACDGTNWYEHGRSVN